MERVSHHLLKAKLFPPKIPSDYVAREDLRQKLDKVSKTPLLLVIAPSGYGKSSLISSWLDRQPFNYGWVSLEESENEYLRFVEYLLTSISSISPGNEVPALVLSELPSISKNEMNNFILNYLASVTESTTIVLDDFHVIRNEDIQELIKKHTFYPTKNVRFIIISRSKPEFVLQDYFSEDNIADLTSEDLAFSSTYIQQYFKKSSGISLNKETLKRINEKTEGWITGLKLIQISHPSITEELLNKGNLVASNMIQQFIDRMDESEKTIVLLASVFKEFNADLISFCLPEIEKKQVQDLINKIKISNIFLINLDSGDNWFRFHHLFNDSVFVGLKGHFSKDKIENFQHLGASWFEQHELFEAAINNYVDAGRLDEGFRLFSSQRVELLNNKNWSQLGIYQQLFSNTEYKDRIEWILNSCWIDVYEGKLFSMFDKLDLAGEVISGLEEGSRSNELVFEYTSLLLYKLYNVDHDFVKCIDICSDKKLTVPNSHHQALALYWIFYLGSLQAKGDTADALIILNSEISKGAHPEVLRGLLLIECYIHYFEGDVEMLEMASLRFLNAGQKAKSNQSVSEAEIFLGMSSYLRGDLELASKYLESAIRKKAFIVGPHRLFASTALCETVLFLKGNEEFESISNTLQEYFMSSGGQVYRNYWLASQMELKAILAIDPIKESSFLPNDFPLLPISNHSDPNLAEIRWLLATKHKSGELVLSKIDRLERFIGGIHSLKVTLSLQVARALHAFQYLNEKDGIQQFKAVWERIKAKKLIMLVVEFGYCVLPILDKLKSSSQVTDQEIEKIVSIINPEQTIQLTRREIDILKLIREPNSEIAKLLHIAEKTVKRHKNNMYKKLNVKNVNEAILAAESLQISKN